MKSIDTKSLLIGVLLASTVFFGVAATSKQDKDNWDDDQEWMVMKRHASTDYKPLGKGFQPFAVTNEKHHLNPSKQGQYIYVRKRLK